jgi:hypothetical protein
MTNIVSFILLKRDNGKRAWMRTDEITAFHENETKSGACLTILMRNNVAWHFEGITGEQLIELLKSGTGIPTQVIDESALGLP